MQYSYATGNAIRQRNTDISEDEEQSDHSDAVRAIEGAMGTSVGETSAGASSALTGDRGPKMRNKRWLDDLISVIKEAIKSIVPDKIQHECVDEVMVLGCWWRFCAGEVGFSTKEEKIEFPKVWSRA